MSSAQSAFIPLAELPVGIPARIAEVRGGRQLARRLLALGLRVGSEIMVLHHRGSGLVVSHGGTRVALGGGIVDKLMVESDERRRGLQASEESGRGPAG